MPFRVGGIRLGTFPTLHDFEEKYIDSPAAAENVEEHLRFARFEEMPKGEIEWLHIGEELWDGRSKAVRNFRSGTSRPIDRCRFHEASVAPGDKACAIGVWSAEQNALVARPGQELWLHHGTKEAVHESLSGAVGCGRFAGIVLIVGSAAMVAYLAGVF